MSAPGLQHSATRTGAHQDEHTTFEIIHSKTIYQSQQNVIRSVFLTVSLFPSEKEEKNEEGENEDEEEEEEEDKEEEDKEKEKAEKEEGKKE